jgi:hypothetical protein
LSFFSDFVPLAHEKTSREIENQIKKLRIGFNESLLFLEIFEIHNRKTKANQEVLSAERKAEIRWASDFP